MIRRDDYMELLYAGKDDNDVVKVVTGDALLWKIHAYRDVHGRAD